MELKSVGLLDVRAAAAQRRSIRAYEPVPIPREDLEEILDVVRLAPSAFNVQPWRFVVVETPELKGRLAEAANQQRQVHSAPVVIVLYTDMEDALENVDEMLHPGMDAAQRAAVRETILRVFGGQSVEERAAWAAGQGYIALGYLLLAAESHGYQTSPMTGFNAEAVKALLGLPASARIPAIVAIGRGSEEGFPAHRHELERILRVA
ncbi:MAG TPA: nitroreductase family protein [Longimicrobiaceae bacterium]|nr:nitroreductase family protein [Longimicrobiaceae bacterium]